MRRAPPPSLLLTLAALCCLPLTGCNTPAQALKPVASQNQENITALAQNVRTLLALYEPLLDSASRTLIYETIGKTEQELIAVVGAAVLPPPRSEQTWETLFDQAENTIIGKREKYRDRFQFSRSATAVLANQPEELKRLQSNAGWIYQAATDTPFTPQRAHTLLKEINNLRERGLTDAEFYAQAETILTPYDPKLRLRRASVEGAKILLNGLKEEFNLALGAAAVHSQAILSFADNTANTRDIANKIFTSFGREDLQNVLNTVSSKYLKDPAIRQSALELLMGGINTALNN